MRLPKAKILFLGLLMLCVLVLSGCWDKKEFTKINMVSLMAVDKEEENFILTVQIMLPKNIHESGGSTPIWILEGRGQTMQDAADDLNARSPRKINWAHMNVVVLGESVLQEDLHRVLDFFVQGQEFRRRNYFLAAQDSAAAILEAAPELAELNTFYLHNLIEDQESRIRGSMVTQNDLLVSFYAEGRDIYLPRVCLIGGEEQSSDDSKDQELQADDEEQKLLEVNGSAWIGQEQLLGWADREWQNGFDWVKCRLHGGSITVEAPSNTDEPDGYWGLRIIKSKCRITLEREEPLTIKIKINAKINVMEDTRRNMEGKNEHTASDTREVEEAFNQKVKQQVEDALTLAQRANADVFGFGQYIRAFHPKLTHLVEGKDYLQTLHFEVEVDGRLKPSSITR